MRIGDLQGIGSATTYLRRYSLAAIAGIAQEDDDGEASSKKSLQHTPRQGAMDNVETDMQIWLKDQAKEVSAMLADNDLDAALQKYVSTHKQISENADWGAAFLICLHLKNVLRLKSTVNLLKE